MTGNTYMAHTPPDADRQEAHVLLRAIVDSTTDLVWSVDPVSFELLWFNRALESYFLRTRGVCPAMGMRPEDLLQTEEATGRWRGFYQRALSEGPFTAEYAVDEGTTRLLLHFAVPERNGAPCGVSVFARDITPLAQSGVRFRTLLERAPGAIGVSRGGVTLYANRAYARMFRFESPEDVIGKPLFDVWAPECRDEIRERVQQREAGAPTAEEYTATGLRVDGTRFLAQVVAARVLLADGPATIGFITDVTERVQYDRRQKAQLAATRILAQALTRGEAFEPLLAAIAGNMEWCLGALWIEDASGGALECSATWHDSTPEMAHLAGELAGAGRPGADGFHVAAWRTSRPVRSSDPLRGSSPWCCAAAAAGVRSVFAVPVFQGDRAVGALSFCSREPGAPSAESQDLVEGLGRQLGHFLQRIAIAEHRDQLNEDLQQAIAELKAAQQAAMQQERLSALGQMASGVAHDINNALVPVLTYSELALDREAELSPTLRRYLGRIRTAASDIAQTVARLRGFCRLPDENAAWEPVDLRAVVSQVIDLTRPRWRDIPQERGVAIRVRPDLAVNVPRVRGLDAELREALTNLVFNGVDAMPEGGELVIRAFPVAASPSSGAGTRVALEVTDTGVGMDEATRTRCLEPFFSTKGDNGTGLGLAMVYGIVNRHEGQIEIDSAPGEGTTVRLLLPACAEGRSSAGDAEVSLAGTPPLKFLLIDDDRAVLSAIADLLQSYGHAVEAAEGGQAGLDAFTLASRSGVPFDLVITDLGMPHPGGREVAEGVKALLPGTPVIMLTGWGERLSGEDSIPPSVDAVVSKPLRLADLRRAMVTVGSGRGGARAPVPGLVAGPPAAAGLRRLPLNDS